MSQGTGKGLFVYLCHQASATVVILWSPVLQWISLLRNRHVSRSHVTTSGSRQFLGGPKLKDDTYTGLSSSEGQFVDYVESPKTKPSKLDLADWGRRWRDNPPVFGESLVHHFWRGKLHPIPQRVAPKGECSADRCSADRCVSSRRRHRQKRQ